MTPLVSIIISTCNRANYLKKAVASILGQTYKNIELIIVDNGSSDGTAELAKNLNCRKKYIFNEPDSFSRGASSNIGIKNSSGKYIARLDDDDWWSDPKKLEKQVLFLENNPEYVLTGGGMIVLDKKGAEAFRCFFPETDEMIKSSLIFDNLFSHGTIVFRKDKADEVGGYKEHPGNSEFPEDWDFCLKMGKLGKLYNFQDYFLYYLQAGQNTFRQGLRQNLKNNFQIRKNYRKDYSGFKKAVFFSLLASFYYFMPFKKIKKSGIKIFGPPNYRKING
ncbi:MAG: hypothetical protein A2365_00500 [Candidatus Nealsonbacteria bacterium RIFOXYB1_FULL_40_15]|uniref:Glycosyltransferase 2-like domain-containing protein n=2 Tax=Candidatus Nealsoniibacteriota TaxID=1817911 RepID=A0A1G2ETR9_9BACT|nr:MAG: hypothetical protein A2365_00500 [Candidatus Nealsonbacteria bacterium RIFOXYB1_FULL_40_15]OGZ28750.1 MAG: hypothetical protein A2427_01680 [Candidatus Nealsonbacteria bacterium RIFOXYC1_FULL_40_7]OGZ29029.1 MAG: hypothetical protein A2562_00930 [Candidatus Nealsonbacteria bacterium RIFOXYD1_FULL_39_11]